MDSHLEELTGNIREANQRLAGLQLQAQQPHLAEKADVFQDINTRARMEGGIAYKKFGVSRLPGLIATR